MSMATKKKNAAEKRNSRPPRAPLDHNKSERCYSICVSTGRRERTTNETKGTKKKKKGKTEKKETRGRQRQAEPGRTSTLFHFNAPRPLKRSASSKWAALRGHGRANIERGGGDGSSDASFIRQAWASASCVDKEVMCTRSFLRLPRSYAQDRIKLLKWYLL